MLQKACHAPRRRSALYFNPQDVPTLTSTAATGPASSVEVTKLRHLTDYVEQTIQIANFEILIRRQRALIVTRTLTRGGIIADLNPQEAASLLRAVPKDGVDVGSGVGLCGQFCVHGCFPDILLRP